MIAPGTATTFAKKTIRKKNVERIMFPAPVYVKSRKKSVATAASQNHRAQKRH
jgi:hypothetical protein